MFFERFGRGRGDRQLVFVIIQIIQYLSTLPFVPWTTASVLALLFLVYFADGGSSSACVSASGVASRGWLSIEAWAMMLGSALMHANDWHIGANSLSFLYKSAQLEASLGSAPLAALIAGLTVVTQVFYVFVAEAGAILLHDRSIRSHCAVGFSGVIFALKVVGQSRAGLAEEYVHGLRVPAKAAAWLELVVIHFLVPGSSFVGHLAGILAGLAFLAAERIAAPLLARARAAAAAPARPRFHGRGYARAHVD